MNGDKLMVDYLPRTEWGARPANGGPGSLTVSRVKGVAIHWPGTSSKTSIRTKAAVASALRGWQAYHMDSRGWSDIAYQVAVDQEGRVWTLRGLRTQSGANGNNDLNEDYGAILLVLIAGEQPTAAMKASVRAVIADFRKLYPNGTRTVPHSAIRPDGTDCPGPAARAAIANGDFTPKATPTPTPEPDMALSTEDKQWIESRIKAYSAFNAKHTDQVEATTDEDVDLVLKDDFAKLQATLDALGAAVAALGVQMTSEDAADDAALKTAVAELKTEIGKAIPQPPKA